MEAVEPLSTCSSNRHSGFSFGVLFPFGRLQTNRIAARHQGWCFDRIVSSIGLAVKK